jgi:hypothetical protein
VHFFKPEKENTLEAVIELLILRHTGYKSTASYTCGAAGILWGRPVLVVVGLL